MDEHLNSLFNDIFNATEETNNTALSVSQVTDLIKNLIDESFPNICIEGEISNFRPSSTGHLYFTLKDEKAAISAVMFKPKLKYLNFEPKDGMKVKITGSISVYALRGTYQVNINTMEQLGSGNILQMLEQRKQKLASEGLFDLERKKEIPAYPNTIGIVTSPTGAALHDILQITKRRNKLVNVIIFPCPVQGEEAAPLIAQQIEIANKFNMVDVLIVGRGGGSLEDLLPFSEEIVVRAVANSKIPTISAVGHEVDVSISDYASDVRAPTPSAAAELAVPLLSDIRDSIDRGRSELLRNMQIKVDKYRAIVSSFSSDNLELRFRRIEQPLLQRLDDAKENLILTMKNLIQEKKQEVKFLTNTLEQINPTTILKRGYSLVYDVETGKIITNCENVKTNQKLKITPFEGSYTVTVD